LFFVVVVVVVVVVVLFLSAIELSVLLRFTNSDYLPLVSSNYSYSFLWADVVVTVWLLD